MRKTFYLLFGPAKHCREYARERCLLGCEYKIVKRESDYYGLRCVKLIAVDVQFTTDYSLYLAAREYFEMRGIAIE